jgi:hypothetical protein
VITKFKNLTICGVLERNFPTTEDMKTHDIKRKKGVFAIFLLDRFIQFKNCFHALKMNLKKTLCTWRKALFYSNIAGLSICSSKN